MDDKCGYCEQEPVVGEDCLGYACCAECWEGMKDWTLEKQAEYEKEVGNLRSWLPQLQAEIKKENGLPEDAPGFPCLRCRKMVQCDDQGNFYCECIDERKGIDPNDPMVVPIPERFLRGL